MIKKLAIVTGASKGIGAGIVSNFLSSSEWMVLGISRSSSKNKCSSNNYLEVLGDLSTQKPLQELKDKLPQIIQESTISEICVVHNYGFMQNASILEITDENWQNTLHANVTVPMLFTRELSPLMPTGSSHIYIGSTLSTIGVPNSAPYVSAKHALVGLMKAASYDLASQGIRCNLICPGFTYTEMAEQVIKFSADKANASYQDYIQALEKQSPLKRLLQPEEVGKVVYFLANTSGISAEVIHINGGFGLVN